MRTLESAFSVHHDHDMTWDDMRETLESIERFGREELSE